MTNFQKTEIKDKNDFKKLANPFIGLMKKNILEKSAFVLKLAERM